jgi:stage IV sporulation protein B
MQQIDSEPVDVAFKQEIHTGEAVIRSAVSGEMKEYTVEIQEIRLNENDVNKGMIFRVTDPELLELTGGIIQGMSGSPILQDGKLIGAVTHVFVNDPAKGYAIFAESMLAEENQ